MAQKLTQKSLLFYGLICGILSPSFVSTSQALEYRSVAIAKAVMLDAPSASAAKLYIIGFGYPVEVIVNLGDWLKVRDNQGGINWVEAKSLANKRTVLVTEPHSEIRQSADESSTLLATVDKDVVLDLLEPNTQNGWFKVRHRDGIMGYIFNTKIWGAN